MSTILTSGGQTSWKNSYASSAQLRLTLRVNGEERGSVIASDNLISVAGFDAPATGPLVTDSGPGNVADGYYQYVYVYASSRYPFVQNDVTAGGEEWPRSSPSPATAVHVSGASEVTVVCTSSARADVDYVWVYRTAGQTTAALAAIEAAAGRFYYVGSVSNDITTPTATLIDSRANDTGEQVEVDNFPCPTFRYTVFDGTYFWGWANVPLVLDVSVDGTDVVTMNESGEWFSGRDGQTATLSGVTSGGYDQRGSFYFHRLTTTTCELCTDAELTTAATIPFTGTTVLTIRGAGTTLYRSKPLNPFSWGRTTEILSADRTSSNFVSDLWAEPVGGGVGTAIALIPNERILKLDTERPARSYGLDLNAADSDIVSTLRTLDEAQSVSSHFSQFAMRGPNSQSFCTGVNAKARQLLVADASSQTPMGDNVISTLRNIQNEDNAPDFFHGAFDHRRELNCWWIKTLDSEHLCDTLLYQHAPTGKWGLKYVPGITASCTVYDYETRNYYTFVGDEVGRIGIAFDDDLFSDFTEDDTPQGYWFATYGESGYILMDYIGTGAVTISVGGLTGTGLTGMGLTDDAVYLLGTASNTLIRIKVTSGTSGTFEVIDTGFVAVATYLDSAVMHDFTSIPVTVVQRLGAASAFPIYSRYVMLEWNTLSYSATEDGRARITVPETSNYGINLDTGEREAVRASVSDGTLEFDVYVGATACSAKRYFTAGTPEKQKKQVEAWTTMFNATAYVRYFNEYADAPVSVQALTEGDTDSNRYKATAPTSLLMPSFGMDIHEVSYGAFQIADLTLKMFNA